MGCQQNNYFPAIFTCLVYWDLNRGRYEVNLNHIYAGGFAGSWLETECVCWFGFGMLRAQKKKEQTVPQLDIHSQIYMHQHGCVY